MPEFTAWVGQERASPEEGHPEQIDEDVRTAMVTRQSLGYPDRHGAIFIHGRSDLRRHNEETRLEHLRNRSQASSVPLEAESNTTDDPVVSASLSGSEISESYTDTDTVHDSEVDPTYLIGLNDAEVKEDQTEMQFRSTADNVNAHHWVRPR
jgi:hypothetical protein